MAYVLPVIYLQGNVVTGTPASAPTFARYW